MKIGKTFLVIFLALTGWWCFGQLQETNDLSQAASDRASELREEAQQYAYKAIECSVGPQTTSDVVNNSGINICGGKMAVNAKLEFKPIRQIWDICGQGAQGCATADTNNPKVYICQPGSYTGRIVTSSWRTGYTYIEDYCDDVNNTIRHELLHLVYAKLAPDQRQAIASKLGGYHAQYADQLALYPVYEQEDELFARVGADGQAVDDPDLIDLYSQVSAAYGSQRYELYSDLSAKTDSYADSYEQIADDYESSHEMIIGILIVLAIVAICLVIGAIRAYACRDSQSDN